MAPTARRRALRTPPRTTRGKPLISYAESSGSEQVTEDEQSDTQTILESPRTSRSQRRYAFLRQNLRGSSQLRNSFTEFYCALANLKSYNSPDTKSKTKSQTSQRKRQHASTSFDSTGGETSTKRRKQFKPARPKANLTQSQSENSIPTSGIVPPWQTLPYDILLQIFRYASYPLYDANHFTPLPSGSWLLKVARLCKDFAEPAFTVLYTSPPLVPMDKAHMLVELLKMDPGAVKFKYRQKVESLRIDVGQVAAYSLPGSGLLDLFSFVKDLPRLKALEFYHQKDMSPYRELEDTIKWNYPLGSLLEALEHVDLKADPARGDKTTVCKLQSWRWSSRLAGKKYPLESLLEIHLKPSFIGLRKIAFVNYQLPQVRKGAEGDPTKHEEILAHSLSVLTNLQHLIVESSTLVNAKLLPLLPKSLHNIELINCWDFHADDFAEFLLSSGSQLRSLTLNHNLSLSLSFLFILGAACPKLQTLHMNLAYFNMHTFYHDSEPNYEKLLLANEIPNWPSTLQSLELTQLRKWDTDACEMFFQSLLDSAPSLLDLRKLTIQAILNVGWRDRASFRDKWIGDLEHIFKRVSSPPKSDISSVVLGLPPARLVPLSTERKKVNRPEQEIVSEIKKSLRLSSDRSAPPSSSFNVVVDPPKPIKSAECKTRRSARKSTRQAQTGKYAESPNNSGDDRAPRVTGAHAQAGSQVLTRHEARQTRISRELMILKQTAGLDGVDLPESPPQTESDDEVPLTSVKRKGKAKNVIQGMCEVVDIRIDNLRPRETMVTEADFLDEERSGDEDWNGEEGAEDDYAW